MLTCYRTRRRIGAYLDEALGDRASSKAAAHIAVCARCRSELVSLRRLATMLRQSAPAAPLPEWTGFWEGIVRRIDAPVAAPRPHIRWRPRLVAGGAVAALAMGVSVAVWQPWSPFTSPASAAISVNSADTTHPSGTVMIYTPPEKDLAVVWLFADD